MLHRPAPLFSAILLVLASGTSFAQEDQAPKTLDNVIVTGTRITDRTVAESQSPIDIISPEALQESGATDLGSALGKLLPSLNFPRPAINDGNDALRPATLRGLSPDAVLVLLDGKRYHTTSLVNYNPSVGRGSAPADLNSIPVSAIARIEVLRDGASAQYGSDAIAGVINIVLKHGAKPGSNNVSVNGGIMDKGDGAQNGVDGSYGLAFGGAQGSGEAPGWARLSWNYQNAMNTNRAENTNKSTTLAGANNPSGIPYERYGDPAVKTYQGLLNFGYALTPNISLYGYANFSRREVLSNGYYRAWNNTNRNVQAVYPNGFLPQIYNPANDRAAVLGIKGNTDSGWNWDVSADYGENDVTFDLLNTINTNLYWSTGSSPTRFNAGGFRAKQGVFNADVSKSFDWGLAYPVNLAFGAEYRQDKYMVVAGTPASYFFNQNTINPNTGRPYPGGSQVFPGLAPALAGDFERHSKAVYADLETNLTEKLSGGLAARYEDYSDAGATRSGKLSARYQINDAFALRGTVSNGFRAPSLAQQNYTSVVSLLQNGKLNQIGTYRTSDPVAIALGAKPLVPEKSSNYSLGAVWQSGTNFSSTLDLYQVRIYLGSNPIHGPIGTGRADRTGRCGAVLRERCHHPHPRHRLGEQLSARSRPSRQTQPELQRQLQQDRDPGSLQPQLQACQPGPAH